LRLRVEWGGQQENLWRGLFQIDGEFSDFRSLGIGGDQAAAYTTSSNLIRIHQPSPRTYDGFDVSVTAHADAKLSLMLSSSKNPATKPLEIDFGELISNPFHVAVDEAGTKLLIRRVPGDRLRVVPRDSQLVYQPGETFHFDLFAHEIPLKPGQNVDMLIELVGSRKGDVIRSESLKLAADENGQLASQPNIAIVLPTNPGAYDIRLSVTPRKSSFVSNPLAANRPVAQRSVQVVVVGPSQGKGDGVWSSKMDLDPVNPPSWSKWLSTRIPGGTQKAISHGEIGKRPYGDTVLLNLAADAWQSFPLPVSRLNTPHVLEIEYPGDVEQILGISIIEPDDSGHVSTLRFDSAVSVRDPVPGETAGLRKHQVLFWPRTKSPYLLVTNLSGDKSAMFGKIRVLQGPSQLAGGTQAFATNNHRLVMAHYTRPHFTENFGAKERFSPERNSTLDDWNTFYDGGERLIQYLQYSGYNAASVNVYSEGSAIYPTRLISPTPQHDMGVFFGNGQDPVQKDVLEMLLRQFDQAKLKFVPSLQFSAPLPELEGLLRNGDPNAVGIQLVDSTGQTWVDRYGSERGAAPYYNPLDPRVQTAMRRVVIELANRYGHHPAFSGVSIQFDINSFSSIPDADWGMDAVTIARFEREMGEVLPAGHGQKIKALLGPQKTKWLKWRSLSLAAFYQQIHDDIAQRDNTRLYLHVGDLLHAKRFAKDLRPALPWRGDIGDVFLRTGLNAKLFNNQSGIVFVRQYRESPLTSIRGQAVELTLNDPKADDYFKQANFVAAAVSHNRLNRRLKTFDALSPFGKNNTRMRLDAHPVAANHHARRLFAQALANMDSQILIDSGWMMPLGREDSLRPMFDSFMQLPVGRFDTIEASDEQKKGVVVRTKEMNNNRYFYLVNNGPWPISVELQLNVPENCGLVPLDSRPRTRLSPREGKATWTVQLEPYDFVAAAITAPTAKITGWRSSYSTVLLANAKDALQQEIGNVLSQADKLRQENLKPAPLIDNSSFETLGPDKKPVQWDFKKAEGITVDVDTKSKNHGKQSLRIRQKGEVAWVRSAPIIPPKSGRLAVQAWIRTDKATPQPKLRVSVEGKLPNGEIYYRFFEMGGNPQPIQTEWGTAIRFPFDFILADDLTDLRIGFDLMTPGTVWIDNVQVYEPWLHQLERRQIVIDQAQKQIDLEKQNLVACQRFIDSFWPRYLEENTAPQDGRMARVPPSLSRTQPVDTSDKGSSWDKFRDNASQFIPKFPFW